MKKKIIVISLIVLVILIIAYFIFNRKKETNKTEKDLINKENEKEIIKNDRLVILNQKGNNSLTSLKEYHLGVPDVKYIFMKMPITGNKIKVYEPILASTNRNNVTIYLDDLKTPLNTFAKKADIGILKLDSYTEQGVPFSSLSTEKWYGIMLGDKMVYTLQKDIKTKKGLTKKEIEKFQTV